MRLASYPEPNSFGNLFKPCRYVVVQRRVRSRPGPMTDCSRFSLQPGAQLGDLGLGEFLLRRHIAEVHQDADWMEMHFV